MRFAAFALLALTIALAPTGVNAAGTVMGSFNCHQPLPCDQTDPSFPTTDQLLAIANACVAKNDTPLTTTSSFFYDGAGVDGKGCFETNPAAFPGTDGLRSIPQCCIKQDATGTVCYIHCELISH